MIVAAATAAVFMIVVVMMVMVVMVMIMIRMIMMVFLHFLGIPFFQRSQRTVFFLNNDAFQCSTGTGAESFDIFFAQSGSFHRFFIGETYGFGFAGQLVNAIQFFFFHMILR